MGSVGPELYGTPPAEVEVGAPLVRRLLAGQHPDLAALALEHVASGWDNDIFRLGADLAVRLPRRGVAATLVEQEQRWLPALARRLPLSIPAPVRVGRPGEGYPWNWSVVPWLPGSPGDVSPPAPREAAVLGAFLAALHTEAPEDAPANAYRGVPLGGGPSRLMAERLERLGAAAPREALKGAAAAWEEGVQAPPAGARRWLHGDLHPRNVLVSDGRISAVIDWGDLTAGDVATDLAGAWLLFDAPARADLLSAYGPVEPGTLARARAWAAYLALALLEAGLTGDAPFLAVARTTLRRLEAP